MKRLSGHEIRRMYLDFFVRHGHIEVPSSSLVPGNDPTLLFTNAGMVPFKDAFLGLERRPYTRATTSQRCLRVSGKHNDLEEVGPSPRHQTFFEMLGNFSFGDYYKAEAIRWAWQLLTEEFEVPVERLWFTIFEGNERIPPDDEAARLWVEVGASPERVLRFGERDNFWVMADTGPCGPNSEITVYIGDDLSKMSARGVNSDDPDYVEIWNLVFMQFERSTMQPLPHPSVDTGMGLERMAMVLQGVTSNYETDLFVPIIERTIALAGTDEAHYREHVAAYRALADHTRACAFLIADGILPGNEGRSYVLRRILRRAAYQGRVIGLERPILAETAEVVIDMMGDAYPELRARRQFILEMLTAEEERFGRTIRSGLVLLDRALAQLPAEAPLPGQVAFTLHDTHGFPLDLTEKIVGERGHAVDEAGFTAAMAAQRERSRQAARFRRDVNTELWAGLAAELPHTEFTAYTEVTGQGCMLALVVEGDAVSAARTGQRVQIALDRTPFYAESGGQIADTGVLLGPRGRIRVDDVQRPVPGLIVHDGVVEEGEVTVGEWVEARCDAERRRAIMRSHTATHLLHRALRDVLGEHAAQAGSLVAPDQLRFDFTHPRPLTPEHLREIAARINAWVRADTPVEWDVTSYQEALDRGAIALFGEKYTDRVRVVTVGSADAPASSSEPGRQCSRELCGGTHVARTGEIGSVRIITEGSVASGVRRIEALTGAAADAWVDDQVDTLRGIAVRIGVPPAQALERVEEVLAELRQRQQELATFRTQAARTSLEELLGQVQRLDSLAYLAARVDAPDAARVREMGDWLRDKLGSGVIVLGTVLNDKPHLLAMVTHDLVGRGYHAGNLVKALAPIVGGGGGGRPDIAQAGGRDASKLNEALGQVARLLQEQG